MAILVPLFLLLAVLQQISSQPLPIGQCGTNILQNNVFTNANSPVLLGNNLAANINENYQTNYLNSLNLENNCANNLAFENNLLSNLAQNNVIGNSRFLNNNAFGNGINFSPSSLNNLQSNAVFTPVLSEMFSNLQYGDVSVNGDLPIGGTIKVRGCFPVYGIVEVDGAVPSSGTAIVNSECGFASQFIEPGCSCANRIL